jgi:hypothetical protein
MGKHLGDTDRLLDHSTDSRVRGTQLDSSHEAIPEDAFPDLDHGLRYDG